RLDEIDEITGRNNNKWKIEIFVNNEIFNDYNENYTLRQKTKITKMIKYIGQTNMMLKQKVQEFYAKWMNIELDVETIIQETKPKNKSIFTEKGWNVIEYWSTN
ncbi:15285_t:CDS:1, partial [Funneliformis geosporum]